MGLTGLTRCWPSLQVLGPQGTWEQNGRSNPGRWEAQGWMTWFLCQVNYKGKKQQREEEGEEPGLWCGTSGHYVDCVNTR